MIKLVHSIAFWILGRTLSLEKIISGAVQRAAHAKAVREAEEAVNEAVIWGEHEVGLARARAADLFNRAVAHKKARLKAVKQAAPVITSEGAQALVTAHLAPDASEVQ